MILSAALAVSAAPSDGSSSDTETLQQVTVTAQLTKNVAKFVEQIAASDGENEDGLPLWHVPVCPSVTGLARQQGEYLLWRVSQIAREAGVPLAGEDCRPNLFVFVTPGPRELLEAMDKRKFGVTFRDAAPLTVDEFIAAARPVKVWYVSQALTAEYATPSYNLSSTHPCAFADFVGVGGTVLPPTICDSERASRVTNGSALVPVFSYVYVIVDAMGLHGVSLQQLADYVGMVGLAKINPAARLGEAPTILKLFGESNQATSPGMSDWDRAFLKSLYETDQRLRMQRQEVANTMVRQLEH